MTPNPGNERWLNNPERRVGREQMLRAKLAGMHEADPRYREYRAMLEAPATDLRPDARHA